MVARRLRCPCAVLCAVVAAAVVAGCGGGDPGGSATTAQTTAGPGREVTVYFSDDSGALVPERRSGPPGVGPLDAAMRGPGTGCRTARRRGGNADGGPAAGAAARCAVVAGSRTGATGRPATTARHPRRARRGI